MVRDNTLNPLVLVECKAASVAINDSTIRQLAVYNTQCNARLLIATNGLVTYAGLCKTPDETFKTLDQIPDYDSLTAML